MRLIHLLPGHPMHLARAHAHFGSKYIISFEDVMQLHGNSITDDAMCARHHNGILSCLFIE